MIAFELQDSEVPKKTDAFLMKAFLEKSGAEKNGAEARENVPPSKRRVKGSILSPVSHSTSIDGVRFEPWESACYSGG